MNSNEIDVEVTKTDNQTFREYLKNLSRWGLIVGIIISIFILSQGILNGHITVSTDKAEFEGIHALLFIFVFIPLGMALNGMVWGLITYLPYLLVKKITSLIFFKSN